tara:strand:+ start:110 stop:400 length:291 start_codon:yes stop_codon:yes gene_type:complete
MLRRSIDKVSKENNLVDVYVNGFHEVATPCEITLTFKDAKHHHKTVTAVLHTRRMIPDEATREKEYWGTLIFPEECLGMLLDANVLSCLGDGVVML